MGTRKKKPQQWGLIDSPSCFQNSSRVTDDTSLKECLAIKDYIKELCWKDERLTVRNVASQHALCSDRAMIVRMQKHHLSSEALSTGLCSDEQSDDLSTAKAQTLLVLQNKSSLFIHSQYIEFECNRPTLGNSKSTGGGRKMSHNGAQSVLGTHVIIPLRYRGWFEILSEDGHGINSSGSLRELIGRDVKDIVNLQEVQGFCLLPHSKQFVRISLSPGTQMSVSGGIVSLGNSIDDLSKEMSESESAISKLVKCSVSLADIAHHSNGSRGQNVNVFLPIDCPVPFNHVATLRNISGLHSVKDIFAKFRFPLNVRLIMKGTAATNGQHNFIKQELNYSGNKCSNPNAICYVVVDRKVNIKNHWLTCLRLQNVYRQDYLLAVSLESGFPIYRIPFFVKSKGSYLPEFVQKSISLARNTSFSRATNQHLLESHPYFQTFWDTCVQLCESYDRSINVIPGILGNSDDEKPLVIIRSRKERSSSHDSRTLSSIATSEVSGGHQSVVTRANIRRSALPVIPRRHLCSFREDRSPRQPHLAAQKIVNRGNSFATERSKVTLPSRPTVKRIRAPSMCFERTPRASNSQSNNIPGWMQGTNQYQFVSMTHCVPSARTFSRNLVPKAASYMEGQPRIVPPAPRVNRSFLVSNNSAITNPIYGQTANGFISNLGRLCSAPPVNQFSFNTGKPSIKQFTDSLWSSQPRK